MRRHRLALLLVPLTLLVSVPSVANASFLPRWDPDDAPGKDLHKVEIYTSDHGKRLNGDLTLWDGAYWYSSYSFEFDSRRGDAMDYVVYLSWDGGSDGLYSAALYRADGTNTGAAVKRSCDDYGCWFPFSFPLWRLHATKPIRWRVTAAGLDYGQRPGSDAAPNTGWYRR